MAKTVIVNLAGLRRVIANYPKFNEKVMEEIAKKMPRKIINSIKAGHEGIFEDGQLKLNKASTINRKIAQGKAPKPLIDTGYLTGSIKPFNITKITGGFKIGMRNKPRPGGSTPYNKVAFYLSEKKYHFLETPRGYVPEWMMRIIRRKTKAFIKANG